MNTTLKALNIKFLALVVGTYKLQIIIIEENRGYRNNERSSGIV